MSQPGLFKPRALIADDDELSLLLLQEVAGRAGFDTVAVGDGAVALEMAMSQNFDIVLLDVEMPKMDGYAVCRALRNNPPTQHLPIVMITGHDSATSIERTYDAGSTDFIAKPLNWPLIPHRLRYILRNSDAEKRIRELAYRDALTGLPNRQAFMETAEGRLAIVTLARDRAEFVILRLDVDACQRINENFGPLIGDTALRAFAQRLAECTGRFGNDAAQIAAARLDGGRFVVRVDGPEANAVADRLAASICAAFSEPIACEDHRFFLLPTIGLAQFPAHGADVTALMMHADTAAHHARAVGSAGAMTYSLEMSTRARERMAVDAELRHAIRREELCLHFQPKLRIADGELVGVEALLRWFHPEHGAISPARFIPVAEDSALILELGQWVMRAACRQLRHWQDDGLQTSIAINVSAKQFVHDDPARQIALAAADSGVSPASITVEITESLFISNLAPVREGLARVRELGCRVAVDDFGTGYSSLAYLRQLPIDELKVDRMFVERVHLDAGDAAIFKAVLSLAHSLNLPVTAEGVELGAQLDWLRNHGCDLAQGFLLARPMDGAKLLKSYGPTRVRGSQVA